MHRRFSSLVSGSKGKGAADYDDNDVESTVASTIVKDVAVALPAPALKVKRVDYYYSRWYKSWKYRNTSAKITIEATPTVARSGEADPWKDFAFVIVRTIPREEVLEPSFKIIVKSPYLLEAIKTVIVSWPGISWNTDPLQLDPELFITFLDGFTEYRDALAANKEKTEAESHTQATVSVLLTALETDYRNTITTIKSLKAHGEITFDFLYAILIPRSIFVTRCAVTGLPRLFKLESVTRVCLDGLPCYQLNCSSFDLVDRPVTQTVAIGNVSTQILIKYFRGTVKIDSLDAFPVLYHSDPTKLKEVVLARGKKWIGLIGVHHKQFSGIAAVRSADRVLRHNVKGRIMVDRATFKRMNPNYKYPIGTASLQVPQQHDLHYPDQMSTPSLPVPLPNFPAQSVTADSYTNGGLVYARQNDPEHAAEQMELNDEELLLTSTVVYGFSLSDKMWLEFDVSRVEDVDWNDDAFANLVLPTNHKGLLQSLVEAHHQDSGFDDFIRGKGHGLVVNLFGPPGVGKTFSAEATSEHVRRPLYLVGAGDLGTDAVTLDAALERVLEVATAWKAIVLIDEADVFLEERSLHDLKRNAMVAVFLRHIEYYRGILFLTTNRVKAFDEAFLSRIHVALHFRELTEESRAQVWTAFINKLGARASVSSEQIQTLARRDVNGRQIKNAARTANSLALGRKETLEFRHFADTLDAMFDFTEEFASMQGRRD